MANEQCPDLVREGLSRVLRLAKEGTSGVCVRPSFVHLCMCCYVTTMG